jgi:RNA polymerase sigma factor (sigma-70 family)
MTRKQVNVILHHLRRMASPSGENISDRELLDRFVNRRDEEAFARLVRRHRPMVQGVCLRVLRHWQDSEDAVQATFLVLARKAGSLRERESAAGWLYRVAYHLALKVRAAGWRRQRREHEAASLAAPNPNDDVRLHEAQALLDEELTNLSDSYRAPILLCCLEGATRDEAARQLGWSLATLKRRLTRGRELLRARLARRGLTLSAALIAPLLAADRSAAASMKPALGDPSARAVALAEGALQAMTMVKLKMVAVLVLAAGFLAAGSGLLTRPARSEAGTEPAKAKADQPKSDAAHPGRKDSFGDVLPPGARMRLGTVRFRHGSDIYDIRLSADGKTVVAVDGSAIVRCWDAATGKELPPLQTGTDFSASAIALSPDGKLLATGGSKRIRLWEAATGKLLRDWDAGYVYALAFSADGKLLASMTEIGPRLWETATGKEIARLKEKNEPLGLRMAGIYALVFSPDGRWLAWGYGKSVILWDVATRQEVRRLEKHGGAVYGIAFSPDGKLLASSGEDRVIRLWEPATGRLVREIPVGDDVKRRHFPGPNGKFPGTSDVRPLRPPVTRLLFAADGQTLFSGSGDPRSYEPGEPRALRLWDVATGKEIASLGEHGRGAWALALTRDGSRLISVDGCSLRVWDLVTRKEVRRWEAHQDWIESITYSPDGQRVATGGGDCTVRLWDAGTGRLLRTLPCVYDAVKSVAFSPDGRAVAAGCRDGFIFLWESATGREIWRMNEGGEVWVTFSPDGKQLIAAGQTTVALRDAATGAEARRINLFGKIPHHIYRVAVSPDGRLLATGDMGCWDLNEMGDRRPPVRLWDMRTGQQVRVLEWPGATKGGGITIRALAFSPDGKILAANEDWATRLWDVATGKLLGQFKGGGPSAVFSPDGRTLATGSYENEAPLGMGRSCQSCHAPSAPLSPGCDKQVRLWEVATGKRRAVLQGHRGSVYALAYSPDGRTLASGSGDATALLWDTIPQANGPIDVEKSWRTLADADAAKAYRAMTEMVAAPERAVALLRERLHPVRAVDPQRLARLLAELDSERFEVREKAAKQIESIGELAKPALHKVLVGKPSLEVRRRIEDLSPKLEPANSPEQLRALRAIEVLEHLGTPAARHVLDMLAQGAEGARLTHEAKASLARLAR